MKSVLTAWHVKLLVLDNLASLASGLDENSKKDWDPINAWLLELRFAGISTVMLHHVGKEGDQRGTSTREDNLDVSIVLKRPHDYCPEEGARFIVHFTKARIPTADLQLIADIEFKLTQDKSGRAAWTWANIRGQRKREILKMLDEALEVNAICEALAVTRQYVSKVKKEAIEKNHLTRAGKLTQSGFLMFSSPEIG